MKLKIILSVVTLALYAIAVKTFELLYSPITGVATANTLNNDGSAEYGLAKFIRDGGIQTTLGWIAVLLFVVIWLSPLLKRSR